MQQRMLQRVPYEYYRERERPRPTTNVHKHQMLIDDVARGRKEQKKGTMRKVMRRTFVASQPEVFILSYNVLLSAVCSIPVDPLR